MFITRQQVKERRLYYPTKLAELELIVRNNFCAVGGQIRFYESAKGRTGGARIGIFRARLKCPY